MIFLMGLISIIFSFCADSGFLENRPSEFGRIELQEPSADSVIFRAPNSIDDIIKSGVVNIVAIDSVFLGCHEGPCDGYGEGQVFVVNHRKSRRLNVSRFRRSSYAIVRAAAGNLTDVGEICRNGSLGENLALMSSCSVSRIRKLLVSSLTDGRSSYLQNLRQIVDWLGDPQADYNLNRIEVLASISQFEGAIPDQMCFVQWVIRDLDRRLRFKGISLELPVPHRWESFWGGIDADSADAK